MATNRTHQKIIDYRLRARYNFIYSGVTSQGSPTGEGVLTNCKG